MKFNKLNFLFIFLLGGAFWINANKEKKYQEMKKQSKKHLDLYLLMFDWLKFKQSQKDILCFFKKNNYKKIAIYGMSYVGKALINELKGSDIEICYGIDQKANILPSEIKTVSIDDQLSDVDVIVVTPISAYTQIEEKLRTIVMCDIVSIEEVIYY